MTVWAIFSETIPFLSFFLLIFFSFMEFDNINSLFIQIVNGLRPKLNDNCPLNELISTCWDLQPIIRPSFEEIEAKIIDII